MITYQPEPIDHCLEELLPLVQQHYHEVESYQEVAPLNVDVDKYRQLYDLGLLSVVTARDGDRLIGYCIDSIGAGLHCKSTLFAVNDAIFVHPDYRGTLVAYRMVSEVKRELISLGVQIHMIHMKSNKPFKRLVEKQGYDQLEMVYSQYIGGDECQQVRL